MQRLTGLDASFLALETPSSHMHVASLTVLDATEVPGGIGLDHLIDIYSQRLHLALPFRRRLVEVPFGLPHPLWIEDPDFDIRNHIPHPAFPPPARTMHLPTPASRPGAQP